MNANEIEILEAMKSKLMDMEIISYQGAQDDKHRNKAIMLLENMICDRREVRND